MTASAPSKIGSSASETTSAPTHSTFGISTSGTRRAMPTICCTCGSAPSASRTLVPTLPLAPVTTTRIWLTLPSRLDHELDRAVFLLLELLVSLGDIVDADLVGGEVFGPERVGLVAEQRHDLVDPFLHVRLAHPQLHALVEELHHRDRVDDATVDAADRDGAAAADRVEALVERRHPVDPTFFDHLFGERVGQEAG